MLHSLICCNEDGYVLLARFFRPEMSLDARKEYEAELARVCGQVPHLWGDKSSKDKDKEPPDQLALCDGQYVVMRQVGELLLLLSGSDEYDELMCTFASYDITDNSCGWTLTWPCDGSERDHVAAERCAGDAAR